MSISVKIPTILSLFCVCHHLSTVAVIVCLPSGSDGSGNILLTGTQRCTSSYMIAILSGQQVMLNKNKSEMTHIHFFIQYFRHLLKKKTMPKHAVAHFAATPPPHPPHHHHHLQLHCSDANRGCHGNCGFKRSSPSKWGIRTFKKWSISKNTIQWERSDREREKERERQTETEEEGGCLFAFFGEWGL